MSQGLEADLRGWEMHAISEEEIKARHPDDEVEDLLRLHRRLERLTSEATPDPRIGWQHVVRRLPDRAPDPIGERWTRPRGRRAGRRRIGALALAAALVLTGGLASAGVLPAPVQDALAHAASHLGVDLPAAPTAPPESRSWPDTVPHGGAGSATAHRSSRRGCRTGREVSAAASQAARGLRREGVPRVPRCDRPDARHGSSGSSASAVTPGRSAHQDRAPTSSSRTGSGSSPAGDKGGRGGSTGGERATGSRSPAAGHQ